jgi:hypothetical protein
MSATPSAFVPDYSDLLVQLVADTDNEYAALKTLHGPFGKWEHYRVALKHSILLECRTRPPVAGASNWTDKLLDAAAHNDPRYRAFLDQGTKEASRFHGMMEARGELAQAEAQQQYGGVR